MQQLLIKSKRELEKILKKEIDIFKDGIICMQSGHFPLIHDNETDSAIPAIFEDVKDKEQKSGVKSHPYMGYFPLTTWKEGMSLIKYASKKSKNIKEIVLVNDWQWVKKV